MHEVQGLFCKSAFSGKLAKTLWEKTTSRAKTAVWPNGRNKTKEGLCGWPHPWASAHNGEERGALGLAAGSDPRGHEEAGPVSLNRDEQGSGSSSSA